MLYQTPQATTPCKGVCTKLPIIRPPCVSGLLLPVRIFCSLHPADWQWHVNQCRWRNGTRACHAPIRACQSYTLL